jgi:hypothetical protein
MPERIGGSLLKIPRTRARPWRFLRRSVTSRVFGELMAARDLERSKSGNSRSSRGANDPDALIGSSQGGAAADNGAEPSLFQAAALAADDPGTLHSASKALKAHANVKSTT